MTLVIALYGLLFANGLLTYGFGRHIMAALDDIKAELADIKQAQADALKAASDKFPTA